MTAAAAASPSRRLVNTGLLAARSRVERRVPWWPAARIDRLQRRRLRAMVRHAYETVPFYREEMRQLGLGPADIRTLDDLAWLPIVEREQVQRDPERFVSTAQPLATYLKLRSGGSTGEPRAVYHDAAALLANAAHGERDRALLTPLIGRWAGYRETILAPPFSSAYEIRGVLAAQTLAPARLRIERQFLSLLDPPARIAAEIDAFAPDVLHGYGSALEMLFARQADGVALAHRPKVVTFSSDALSDEIRRVIEEDHGIPVYATYQAIEALKIGFECERRAGYHLNTDLYPVRVVDEAGRELPPGVSGEVVVSNLVNRATVLLNYRLGDLGTLAPEPCSCGRSLPLLAALLGRSDDVVVLPSGRSVHPQALRTVFTNDEQVRQYQLVQQSATHFSLAVVADHAADHALLRERVVRGLAERLADPVTIDVSFVDAIARAPSGKLRPIVSKYRSGPPIPPAEEPRDG